MEKIDKIYHLSHTDLDGYGCQYISKEVFDNITFLNANYGREVLYRINGILNKISGEKNTIDSSRAEFGKSVSGGFGVLADKLKDLNVESKTEQNKTLILISDLGLTLNESTYLNTRAAELNASGKNVEILLLDHHISGEECAKKFSWYKLDDSMCATKIVFKYLEERIGFDKSKYENLSKVVEMINSVDIWKEEGYKFDFGKVAMGMISGSNEINRIMFDVEHREYKFKLMDNFIDYIERENSAVAFDNDVFKLKKIALGGIPDKQTMDDVVSCEQVRLLGKRKNECEISADGYKGFLSYYMGGISVLGNLFLVTHTEYDFYMDVNSRGNVSLRSNNKCDVSELSAKFFNGGGHKNASGGRIEGFRDSFSYRDIKEQVLNTIQTKEGKI